jgi:hypothetical protein
VIGLIALLLPLLAGCGGGNLCCDSGSGSVDVNVYGPVQNNQPPADGGAQSGGQR